jgi:RNA polymerase sigma-70 factor, ECF subfamily
MAELPLVEGLYERYGAVVYRRARRLLGDEQAAWDAVQEVFVRALKHARRFRREASPTTWLYRITTNYCLNILRDAARHDRKLGTHAGPAPASADPHPDLRLTMVRVLSRLPKELGEIAVYHHVDRMSHEEIASVIGVSRRTVGNRLKEFQERALALLGPAVEVFS